MNWKSIKEWFVAEHPPIDPGDVVCTVDGKEEERKSRDMHWLRIDRYFHSEMDKDKAKDKDKGNSKNTD